MPVADRIYHLIGIFEPERDYIAVIQRTTFNFLAVYEKTSPLPFIFNVIAVRFHDDRRAITRNATIGQLQVVPRFRSPADEKRDLRDAHVFARTIGRNDFKDRFNLWQRFGHALRLR